MSDLNIIYAFDLCDAKWQNETKWGDEDEEISSEGEVLNVEDRSSEELVIYLTPRHVVWPYRIAV